MDNIKENENAFGGDIDHKVPPDEYHCTQCSHVFNDLTPEGTCPLCGSSEWNWVHGKA